MPTITVTRPGSLVTNTAVSTCLNIDFLYTRPGLCKIFEVVFGGICVGLMITYGTPVWITLGIAYPLFLVASSAAVISASVCLFSYLISAHTFLAIRTTVLEIVQNIVSAVLYASGSTFLIMQTMFFLWPMYIIIPYFQAYPALMTAGVFGCFCAFIHTIDAYLAYRALKSIR